MTDGGASIGADAATERARWSDSAAAWDRWAERLADQAARINRPLLELLALVPGGRMLDLACGVGEPALTAAESLGADGLVVATDLVPSMLVGARRRALERAVHPLFAAADMTRLPFPSGCFDAVSCRFGIMFVPDLRAALGEIARTLRPGGRAAFAVWAARSDNTLFDLLARSVDSVLGPDPQDRLAPLFRFAESDSLPSALRMQGGFSAECRQLRSTVTVPVDRPFWRPTLEMAFSPRLAHADTVTKATLEADIVQRFTARASDGVVALEMAVNLVLATRKAEAPGARIG